MVSQNRLSQLLGLAEGQGLDALALVPGPNLLYATGLEFILSERPVVALLPVDGNPTMVLPEFEAGKAIIKGFDVFPYTDEEGYALAFHEACAILELAEARVGVESFQMRLLEARILERYAPDVTLAPADTLFAQLRMCKQPDEIAAMRRAVAVAETAFKQWLAQLTVGMTEREAASLLVGALLSNGADALSFEPIVASGPNAALPHSVPGERRFQSGDWVVVDWGAYVDGYASDITRPVVFGTAGGDLFDIFEVVAQANEAGRAAVAPGVSAESVDAAARAVIEDAGYGPLFNHRTGHGLGMEVHEPPYIVAGNTLILKPGMTFTVEPGAYIEGVGGVRVEDDVAVTESGSMTLTTLPRIPYEV